MNQGGSYRYQPLPTPSEQERTPPFTRLLLLRPGSAEDPFEAHLELVNIEQAPPYEALSYTWGKPTDESRDYIWLEGHPLLIKPNLEDALRSLRLPNLSRRLWIDALCIDQSNLDERARQVQYMRLVYKHATRVIVWLGLKTVGTHEAFLAAERLARIREFTFPTNGLTNAPSDPDTIQAVVNSMVEDLPETWLTHLDEVFQRPYFTRCWCVQEVVASTWAIAKIEDEEVSFFDLIASMLMYIQGKGEIAFDKPWELWSKVLMVRQPNNVSSNPEVEGSIGKFLDTLDLTRTLQATDDRDKVFSLFGICDEGLNPVLAFTQLSGNNASWSVRLLRRGLTRITDFVNEYTPDQSFGRPKALKPDYKRETVMVYSDLTRFLLRKQPRFLDVLDHVAHVEEPGAGEWPSWVPKWFDRRTCFVFKGAYMAGFWKGRKPYVAELYDIPLRDEPERPRVLSAGGYRFDVVHKTTEVLEFLSGREAVMAAVAKGWATLFDTFIMPRRGIQYRNGGLLDVAYCKAVLAGFLGASVGLSFILTQQHGGLNPLFDVSVVKPFVGIEGASRVEDIAATFLAFLALIKESGDTQATFNNPELDNKVTSFLSGVTTYANHRRAFVTRDGRVGLGPKMMQPGDEVVVLFGGRMPFIVRPRADHYLLVGSCYVNDEELMWGKVTDKMKRNEGPPKVVFEFH
ncbi:het domain-containing protein [Colletotrichum truncatum]|uniref:Het domain-containing protein n=1 Tax=Colletotrichum truncatum TaxID=5467 RepID=A0ACC3Z889_COLTU|nr:het domain-containing protein [Colletotrichum truncatum]KAF6789124.1 het domain-containing protein [Colletotrichum truncatum]